MKEKVKISTKCFWMFSKLAFPFNYKSFYKKIFMFYQKPIYNFNASLMILFFFFTKLTKEKNNKNKKEKKSNAS